MEEINEIDILRDQLKSLNQELFQLFEKRKLIARQIQKLKTSNAIGYYRWDIAQEKKLFSELDLDLEKLSIREKMAFSLLIEEHAHCHDPASYPEWSKAEHLGADFDLLQQINPLMITKGQRGKLPMSSHFQEVFDMIDSDHEKI